MLVSLSHEKFDHSIRLINRIFSWLLPIGVDCSLYSTPHSSEHSRVESRCVCSVQSFCPGKIPLFQLLCCILYSVFCILLHHLLNTLHSGFESRCVEPSFRSVCQQPFISPVQCARCLLYHQCALFCENEQKLQSWQILMLMNNITALGVYLITNPAVS